ncbi:PREDICTED: adhesion G-protein coupled receptor F1-like [Cyprinodon variegatus]|uniref:adhesion G-protein coupled receptor F1-like n=1 Tax=Cyprinodon variegatus TaxID=28743 RepID=UPI0007425243|nr:PREDICTED: adhesion G-protein coupled receptor F1-like [Cyprinodon variegatus]
MWTKMFVPLIGAVCIFQVISNAQSTTSSTELFSTFDSNINSTNICECEQHTAEETNKKQGSEPLYVNFNSSINSITYTCEQAKDYICVVEGQKVEIPCDDNMEGQKTAVCMANGEYGNEEDNCVLTVVLDLLNKSMELNISTLPNFLEELRNVTVGTTEKVTKTPASISSIVTILNNVADTSSELSLPISRKSTEHILVTAGLLTSDEAKNSWDILNDKPNSGTENNSKKESPSSSFLKLFETVSSLLVNESLTIETPFILLKKTELTDPFYDRLNSSVTISIPETDKKDNFITTILFASMDNVLPPRDKENSGFMVINGKVVLVETRAKIKNISIISEILNDTLKDPQCVFWDFDLFDGLGGWSNQGCSVQSQNNETISCICNHLTCFSILMSSDSFKDSELEDITFIGVGISIGSLVICLITEALIWKKISTNTTAFLRHVFIVNIAVSLLIANIWFIVGGSLSGAEKKNPPACAAATFFIHFFYLAMFFWMLATGLLLLYRTVLVFEGGFSKTSMLVSGFVLGYGAPLIISVTTMAVTLPSYNYIRANHACWLNWDDSKALLAFLVPALVIVFINFIILLVVIFKMLNRRVKRNTAQAQEQHVLVVIARSLAVLTPFFGLTWSLGIGTIIAPTNKGIHFAFSLLNSLQGCFIWVFGTLLDKRVRSEAIKSLTTQEKTSIG